jgi:peptidoglycan/LPS O-acetylase OafA/YrhL
MNHSRVHHIDAWRFVAIAIVILCHMVAYSHPWYRETAPAIVWRVQAMGTIGVQVFFCISGYVICFGMLREKRRFGDISMRGFYIRRACRILPPLVLYVFAVATLAQAGVLRVPTLQLFQSIGFLCNIKSLPECVWPLGHTWSLAYEEQFYLVFPWLFGCLALSLKRQRIALVIAVLGIGALVAFAIDNKNLSMAAEHFLCMSAGCACALYWDRLSPIFIRMPVALWILSVALIFATCFFTISPSIRYSLIPFVIPGLICIAVFGTPIRYPAINAFFSNSVVVYFGQISYTIYLWQQLATDDYGFASPLSAILLVMGVFIFADVSYRFFEMRFIRFGVQLTTRPVADTENQDGVISKGIT